MCLLKNNNVTYLNLFCCCFGAILSFSSSVFAESIFTNTVKTIEGHRPEVDVNKLSSYLGFNFSDESYSRKQAPVELESFSINNRQTFSSFSAIAGFYPPLPDAQTAVNEFNYQDIDGDGYHGVSIQPGDITLHWYDGEGENKVPLNIGVNDSPLSTNTGDKLTLRVYLRDAVLSSEYGVPKETSLGELYQDFLINVVQPDFGIKPRGMSWWDDNKYLRTGPRSGKPTTMQLYGGGYSDDFDPVSGFKLSLLPGEGFPSTAFKGAEFSIMTPKQTSNYTFSIDHDEGLDTSRLASEGILKFVSLPSSTPYKIKISSKTTTEIWEHTFKIRKWYTAHAEAEGEYWYSMGYPPAKAVMLSTACQSIDSRLATYPEIIQSSQNVNAEEILSSNVGIKVYETRKVNAGLFDEWAPAPLLSMQAIYPDSGINLFFDTATRAGQPSINHEYKITIFDDTTEFWNAKINFFHFEYNSNDRGAFLHPNFEVRVVDKLKQVPEPVFFNAEQYPVWGDYLCVKDI